ncbi:MAG: hypothetical protein IPK85_01590 [Gemmatimonadetes bacterium]|nr:hypothetical protein [Gemmatimonadota bacterium]
MNNYRDVPREALVAEIERLQREVALLRRPRWWERLFARRGEAQLKLPAAGADLKPAHDPRDAHPGQRPQPEGTVRYTPSKKFVCVTLRGIEYGRRLIKDLETYSSIGPDDWFVAATGASVSDREAGDECFRLFCQYQRAQVAESDAAALRAEFLMEVGARARGLLR